MTGFTFDQLYAASEEDILFGIGHLATADRGFVPYIHLHFPAWDRARLEAVHAAFRGGISLVVKPAADGTQRLFLATRERVAVQIGQAGQTSALEAPAWDAALDDVAPSVVRHFEADRQRLGGFTLLLQTPDWEFLTAVHDMPDPLEPGPITDRCFPTPPENF